MPEPHLLAAFVAAVLVMMMIPGPNVALIVSNSLAHGSRYGLLTVAGTSSAMVVQLSLTALGMAQLLGGLGLWFDRLRWVGVAYLLYLGIRQWRAPPVDLSRVSAGPKSPRRLYARAFLVSFTNPKTLVFYGAFFPQFVTPGRALDSQLGVLCACFLGIALCVDSLWSLLAGRARALLAGRGTLRNRLGGGALIGAGLALAATRAR